MASFSCRDGQYKRSKHEMHCMLCMLCMLTMSRQKIKECNAFNAKYVKTVNYKTHPRISAHNILNIQLIFNLKKVLES